MKTELDVQIRMADDIPIVDLSGDIDAYTCSKLRETIVGLLNEGESRVVIGMANVGYIDSSGLGTLVGGLRRACEQNGALAISGANPQIQKVLMITGLNKVFPLYDTEIEAVKSIKS